MLDSDVEFFDHPDNNPALISANLESDTNYINSLLTSVMAVLVKTTSMILMGVILAFAASWRMSLVVLAVIPLLAVAGAMSSEAAVMIEDGSIPGGHIVHENISNLKTVRAMNCVDLSIKRFNEEIDKKVSSMWFLLYDGI